MKVQIELTREELMKTLDSGTLKALAYDLGEDTTPTPTPESTPEPIPIPTPEPAPRVSLDELKTLIARLTAEGQRARVKEILMTQFGATKLAEIPEGCYLQLYEALQ